MVGKKIGSYLKERGIMTSKLAIKTGIPAHALYKAFAGNRDLSFDEYTCICDALEVPVTTFMERKAGNRRAG